MMRLAGFPTRVVTGYHGGELNNLGEYYIVRQSDTHAWTEIWLADRGWVRVDPIVAVAPERIALGSSRTSLSGSIVPGTAFGRIEWVRQALLAWDAANTYWNEWVLGYGPELQRALLEALGLERPHRVALAVLAAGATVVLLFALTLYLAWCYRHRRRPDPALRCFEAFGRRLDRLRVPPRVPCESPDAYARRARAVLPRAAADIERIVRAYLRARYEPDEEHRALDTLRRLVRDFRPARA